MRYTQSPPLNDQDHERDVDLSYVDGERDSQRTGNTDRPNERLYRPRSAMSRSPQVKNDSLGSDKRSISKRIYRALARFFFAVLIGVGGTLAWQSYADEANEMIRIWAPSLGWLFPVSAMKSPAPAVTSAELAQQVKPIALDLAIVRRSVEQLAADQDQLARKQEQMAQVMATLRATEQDVVQKISSPPPPTAKAVRVPPPKPPPQ